MLIARYEIDGQIHYGKLEENSLKRCSGSPFATSALSGDVDRLDSVRLLCPVEPPRIFGAGLNYVSHIEEMKLKRPTVPLLFMKPTTAAIGPNEPIVYPREGKEVHFEGELAVIIGRRARRLRENEALDAVFGYTCANDVTARDQQASDGQWSRAKGYDSFCPLGPWIETDISVEDLRLTTTLNGEVKQDGRTKQIVHKIPKLITYITACMSLLPGDVILTGTPAGVGPMQVGDEVAVEIEGVGRLANTVVAR